MEPSLRTEIRSYYERAPERDRLELSLFELELARTKEMIRRFLPEPPALVLDVGGGAGRYAAWLAALGYEVHLIDPVRKLERMGRMRAFGGISSIGWEAKWKCPFPPHSNEKGEGLGLQGSSIGA
jgi:2-polyprenyl-3-methyl-5-hydroxy-6-metoxy-1,4-benzoquinol methylase